MGGREKREVSLGEGERKERDDRTLNVVELEKTRERSSPRNTFFFTNTLHNSVKLQSADRVN